MTPSNDFTDLNEEPVVEPVQPVSPPDAETIATDPDAPVIPPGAEVPGGEYVATPGGGRVKIG